MAGSHTTAQKDINRRIRQGYLERLETRMRKMRRHLAERNWNGLRIECIHLQNTARSFGFREIAELSRAVSDQIPEHAASKAKMLPEAKKATEKLLAAIDQTLMNRQEVLQ